jgi:hypothetical protein
MVPCAAGRDRHLGLSGGSPFVAAVTGNEFRGRACVSAYQPARVCGRHRCCGRTGVTCQRTFGLPTVPVDCGARSPPIAGPPVPRSVQVPRIVMRLARLRSGLGTPPSPSTKRPGLAAAAARPPPDTLTVRPRCAVGGSLGGERVLPGSSGWCLGAPRGSGETETGRSSPGCPREPPEVTIRGPGSSQSGPQDRPCEPAGGPGRAGERARKGADYSSAGAAGGGRQPRRTHRRRQRPQLLALGSQTPPQEDSGHRQAQPRPPAGTADHGSRPRLTEARPPTEGVSARCHPTLRPQPASASRPSAGPRR